MVCVIQTAPLSNYRHVKDLKKEYPVMLEYHIELLTITLCSLVEVYKCSNGTCYFHYHCTWWRHTFLWNTGTLLPDYTVLLTKTTAVTIASAMRHSKFVQITMTIYVRETQDLFVHIQLETVICNCPEENRSNLQEKQPCVDEVSKDSILTCVWEQWVLNIQILKNANIDWGWSHKWNCAVHSKLNRAQIRRNKMLKM